ncbi:WXG100 family type VII secretion target [Nocardioides montaniterrae]
MGNDAPIVGQGAGVLSQAAKLVADAKADFAKQSQNLDSQIAQVKGRWGGAGATAFHSLHVAWTEKHQTIVNALNNFEASLQATEKDNMNTDQSAGDAMTSLSNKLGSIPN